MALVLGGINYKEDRSEEKTLKNSNTDRE